MKPATLKTSKGLLVVTTPEGREYRFPSPSTKRLDPKLKAEGKQRTRAMRVGFQKAVKKAYESGVPLQQVVPVS